MDIKEGHMGSVLFKLSEFIEGDFDLPTGTKEDLKSLSRELRRLRACYYDVAGGTLISSDLVREVFYEAENLLYFRDDMASCIRQIIERAREAFTDMRGNDQYQACATSMHCTQGQIELVGIDGPRDELIQMLSVGDDISKKQNKIVSIVGVPGLGKTALAYTVYQQLKPQFDCAAFVKVPHEPAGMQGFFTDMLCQLDAGNRTNIDEEPTEERQLISEIREFLHDKRYLIVIDDFWNEEDWDSISQTMPSNGYCSRVITTTPFHAIASLCCSGDDDLIYEIKHLQDPYDEELFSKVILACGVDCPNTRTDVFHEILKMCGGTPSAIKCVASALACSVTATKPWQEMMNSVYSAWKQKASSLDSPPENIPGFEELKLIIITSSANLPCTLKDCLLYLAAQAKNQLIHRTTMVRKWIAEGFISEYGRCSREEVASRYFDELVKSHFIQLAQYGNYLGEEIYEVNYMVLHVLRLIADLEKFAIFLSDTDISMKHRHSSYFEGKCRNSARVSIHCSGSIFRVRTKSMNASRIRSITIAGPIPLHLESDLLYLRVLDLDGCKNFFCIHMVHVCKMILLKYLSLKNTRVSVIPPEIGKLLNLETLDVRQTQVKWLPKEVVQLIKLEQLYFGQCDSPCALILPKSVKVLGTIDSREWSESAMEVISQWLTGVTELEVVLHDQAAGKDRNDNLLSSIGKCEKLEYLIIHGDYNPSDDVVISESSSFRQLERLKVTGRFMKVPQWLAYLGNLKKLVVRVCKLDQDDLKILAGLSSLSSLALALICIPRKKQVTITTRCNAFPPLEEECPAGFESLKVFNFECHVPWITFEEGAMPNLKYLHLKLYTFPEGKFPSGIINLRSLEKIILCYSSDCARSPGVKKAVAAVKEQAASHSNRIKLSIDGNNEVFAAKREETSNDSDLTKISVDGNDQAFAAMREGASRDHNLIELSAKGNNAAMREEASSDCNLIQPSVNGNNDVFAAMREEASKMVIWYKKRAD